MAGLNLPLDTKDLRLIVSMIRSLLGGGSNAVGTCTLAANAATTTVAAFNCAPTSLVFLFPMTAHAGAEFGNGTIFVLQANIGQGQFIISHANNAQADRTFAYVTLG